VNHSDDLDPRLQQLYRQLPKEQPSPELDATILTAAQQAIKKPSRWLMPFSMAASVVMVGSLVLYWVKQPETLQQATAIYSSPEKRVAELTMAIPPASDVVIEKNSEVLLSNSGASVKPQIAQEKSLAVTEFKASVAMDDKVVDELNDLRSEPRQNSIDNQPTEIKEEVVNIAASPPPMIAKQDRIVGQASDDNVSPMNQPMIVADRIMQEKRPLATAQRPKSVGLMAKMQAEKKAIAEHHEEQYKLAVIKPNELTIEGVGLGMSGEQLQAQGFSCEMNTCSQTLNHPQQESYWGIASQNAHIDAVLSNNVVMMLSLTQSTRDVDIVQESLLSVGVASQKRCVDDKEEKWRLSRLLGTTVIQLNAIGNRGLVLNICQ
jgi:hypothetical protein